MVNLATTFSLFVRYTISIMASSFHGPPARLHDFVITKANEALLQHLGKSPADVMGRPCEEVLPKKNAKWTTCPYCARGDVDFRLAVDRALSHIYRSGEIAAVFAHTFGNQMQPSDTLKTLYLVSALPD